MESFIVRIYRHAGGQSAEPTGTVERVGSGERAGFSSREQLLRRLLDPQAPSSDAVPQQATGNEPTGS